MTNACPSTVAASSRAAQAMPGKPDQPRLMGILNLTPESFSDGGRFFTDGKTNVPAVVATALDMARAGAGIIDFGAEATSFHRVGVEPVSPDEQIRRLSPALQQTRLELDQQGFTSVIISIDTRSARVARAALDSGAGMINDVAGGRSDPAILSLAASARCPVILMHAWPETPERPPKPRPDVVSEIRTELQQIKADAIAAGVGADQILLDPGIGFGKASEDNWRILRSLDTLRTLGVPLALGISRKRITRDILPSDMQDWRHRDLATAILMAALASGSVAIYRVHDIRLCQIALAAMRRLCRSATNEATTSDHPA